ncbi:MAG TPA: type 1 glutamine amidotransferase domain-containing protein [Cellvibrionaceae bacterium]
MKNIIHTVCAIISLIALIVNASESGSKKILIVASSMTEKGGVDARNNLWEYAPPYHIFVSHGYEVDFVSPQGGPVSFMMDPIGISSYTIKYEGFMDKANNSLTPGQINPEHYQGVYIGGGYGTLFDVASDAQLLNIMAAIYQQDGVIGSCGHGAGAFANVKLSDGQFLVKGKRVAGFPNSTEREKSWAQQGELLPFLVEDKLRTNGAIAVNKESIADKNEVIIDQRVVSSMFLPSAASVAKEMIELIESPQPYKL